VFFKFRVEVGVELSIVNALYGLRITDQLFKSYAFTRVVRSQSTLQRQIKKKNTLYIFLNNVHLDKDIKRNGEDVLTGSFLMLTRLQIFLITFIV
jgi:hypothetical protein